jgi:ribonuclease PH
MDLEEAIRSRRTHKAYAPEPVDRQTLDELLELASAGIAEIGTLQTQAVERELP